MRHWLLALAVIAGALAGILLGALNPESVTLELFFIEWTASLGAIVAISGAAGLIAGFSIFAVLRMVGGWSRATRPTTKPGASKKLDNG